MADMYEGERGHSSETSTQESSQSNPWTPPALLCLGLQPQGSSRTSLICYLRRGHVIFSYACEKIGRWRPDKST